MCADTLQSLLYEGEVFTALGNLRGFRRIFSESRDPILRHAFRGNPLEVLKNIYFGGNGVLPEDRMILEDPYHHIINGVYLLMFCMFHTFLISIWSLYWYAQDPGELYTHPCRVFFWGGGAELLVFACLIIVYRNHPPLYFPSLPLIFLLLIFLKGCSFPPAHCGTIPAFIICAFLFGRFPLFVLVLPLIAYMVLCHHRQSMVRLT